MTIQNFADPQKHEVYAPHEKRNPKEAHIRKKAKRQKTKLRKCLKKLKREKKIREREQSINKKLSSDIAQCEKLIRKCTNADGVLYDADGFRCLILKSPMV